MDTEQLNTDFLRADLSISVNIRIFSFFIDQYGEQSEKIQTAEGFPQSEFLFLSMNSVISSAAQLHPPADPWSRW